MVDYDSLFRLHPGWDSSPKIELPSRSVCVEPGIVAIWGPPGSGKTTIADSLRGLITNGVILDIDRIRNAISGTCREVRMNSATEANELTLAFQAQQKFALELPDRYYSPVLTSTGRTERHRFAFRNLATKIQNPSFEIVVYTPYQKVLDRVLTRKITGSDSNIRNQEALDLTIKTSIPYPEDAFYVDGSADPDEVSKQILYYMTHRSTGPTVSIISE